jgi:hypothetical protein
MLQKNSKKFKIVQKLATKKKKGWTKGNFWFKNGICTNVHCETILQYVLNIEHMPPNTL